MASMRKKFIGVAALAFVAALSAGVASVNVQANTDNTLSGFAITATSVRTNEPAGLRFKTDVGADAKTTYADAECYTVVSFTSSVSGTEKTYTAEVPAQVWRAEEDGWNTVLLDIPASDYATEITAKSFIVGENFTYETAPVTVSIADTAAKALVDGIATKADVGHYAQGLVATATFDVAGGTISAPYAEQSVYTNGTVSDPATVVTPGVVGKAFAGWTLNGELFDFETPLTEDVTLVAKYEDGAALIDTYYLVQNTAAGAEQGHLAYVTDVVAPGEDHSWRVSSIAGGWGKCFDFNSADIEDGAEMYTFKVMAQFTPTTTSRPDKQEYYYDAPGGIGYYQFKVNGAVKVDVMETGVWYDVTVDPATFEACCSGISVVWQAQSKAHIAGSFLYITDVKAVSSKTVTFDVAGGAISAPYAAQTIASGNCAVDPATSVTPSKYGAAFKGWTLNGELFDFATPITEDITLVAAYEDNAPVVDYYYLKTTNGKTGAEQGSLSYVTDVKAAGTDHSWKVALNVRGNGLCWNFNTSAVQAGADAYTFKVMFDFPHTDDAPTINSTANRSDEYYQLKLETGNKVLVDKPVAGEWYKVTVTADELAAHGEGLKYVIFHVNGAPHNGTASLYMTDIQAVATHTVTFDANGGKLDSATQLVETGDCAVSVVPSKYGEAFKAWTLNGKVFDFSTPITGDITLVATYQDNAPIVDYYYLQGGGRAPESYISYNTDSAYIPDGEDHTWKVQDPVGGYGRCLLLDADLQDSAATAYTFKVMFVFPHTEENPNVDTTTGRSDAIYQLKCGSAIVLDAPNAGEWYTVTLTPAQFADAINSNKYFVFQASGPAHQGTCAFYMTDITVVK